MIGQTHLLTGPPPFDEPAEQALLGSLILCPSKLADVAGIVEPGDCYRESHRAIFQTLNELRAEGVAFQDDAIIVLTETQRRYPAAGVTPELIERLMGAVPIAEHAAYYGQQVRDAADRRRIVHVCRETLQRAQDTSVDPADLLARLDDVRAGRGEDSGPAVASLADLIRDHAQTRPVLIDGLLRRGEVANIIAAPKVGKSWLTYSLALSVATGRPWLDTFQTMPGRVLIIDNELHPETLASRIPMVADAMAIPESERSHRLDVLSLRGRLMDIVRLSRLVESLHPDQYHLVIVDAWYRMLPPNVGENDNAAMASLFNRVDQYAAQTGAAWCLIHHASKGNQSDRRVTDVGSGAGSQSRAADSHIVLREHEEAGCVVMDAAVRSFPPVTPLALQWEFPLWRPVHHLDPSRLADPRSRQQAVRDVEGRQTILDALADGPLTERKLRAATRLSKERLERLATDLESSRQIVAEEIVVSGHGATQYRLPEPVDAADSPGLALYG